MADVTKFTTCFDNFELFSFQEKSGKRDGEILLHVTCGWKSPLRHCKVSRSLNMAYYTVIKSQKSAKSQKHIRPYW